jgi:hypothetical protein
MVVKLDHGYPQAESLFIFLYGFQMGVEIEKRRSPTAPPGRSVVTSDELLGDGV